MNTLDTIKSIYDSSLSRNDRLEMLRGLKDNELGTWFFTNLLAPNQTFGIRISKADAKQYIDLTSVNALDIENIKSLLPKLINREVTGNEAKEKVGEAICWMSQYADLGIKLINRETPPLISYGSIQPIWPDKLIRNYACGKCRGKIESFEKLGETDKFIAQKKYDGLRVLMVKEEGEVVVYTNNFNRLYTPNFQRMINDLDSEGLLDKYVVDGEVEAEDRQSGIGWAMTKKELDENVLENHLRYRVFDLIPLDEWNEQNGSTSLLDRLNVLSKHLSTTKYATKANWQEVHNITEVMNLFHEVVGDDGTKGEGLVLKDIRSPYIFGDNPSWIKVKFADTYDGEIIEIIEGQNRLEGSLGALVVKLEDGTVVHVGGGYSDELRKEIWNNQGNYIGRIIEFKGNGKTKYGVPNHPNFVAFREDKE